MQPLNEQELDLLADFFDDEARSDDCLDFYGVHGLLTAWAISPNHPIRAQLIEQIFDGNPDFENGEQQTIIENLLLRLLADIEKDLTDEESPAIPFDPAEPGEEVERMSWCAGFLDLVFTQEDLWFSQDEEAVSTLLLPIETGSDLFSEEQEFIEIAANQKLFKQLMSQIPDVLVDLYLLMQVPDNKTRH